MKKKINAKISSVPVQAALLASLVLIGGYIEVFVYLISAAVATLLVITVMRNGKFRIRWNPVSVAALCIPLFYLISAAYAADSGMAFLGFLKYASVGLFALLVMQFDNAYEDTVAILPYFSVILGAVSLILMLTVGSPFSVDGRLSGTLEYPNTFAMLLLVGELAALMKDKLKIIDIVISIALAGMILLTGSRTVLALTAVSVFAILMTKKNKRLRMMTLIGAGVLAAVAVALYLLRDTNAYLSRMFAFSVTESTFAGRLLYFSDSLKLIGNHPFGLGYMGYSYLQAGIQTGVYTVKNVHNGVLQLMLDIGWIPAALFIAAVVQSLFSKRLDAGRKIILATFFLHTLFDFDLSFPAMFCLMILLMDTQAGKERRLTKNTVLIVGAIGVLELYFAVHAGLWYLKAYDAADAMFPYNTENKTAMMLSREDITEQEKVAERITDMNENVLAAQSVKAAYAYSQGDIQEYIRKKKQILEAAPFCYEEYEDYAYKLIDAIGAYMEISDEQSAKYCAAELIAAKEKLVATKERLSPLGKVIQDQPVTEFPKEIEEYIEKLQ